MVVLNSLIKIISFRIRSGRPKSFVTIVLASQVLVNIWSTFFRTDDAHQPVPRSGVDHARQRFKVNHDS